MIFMKTIRFKYCFNEILIMKRIKEGKKGFFRKIWNFLWKEDSFLSWITFLLVVFIFIKFIFFPSISFIAGTSLPIVIVESCSMYHDSSFNIWWEKNKNWY